MSAFSPTVRMAMYSGPDPRLEPCAQCCANGWVPEMLSVVENIEHGTRPIIARNVCDKCHGEGWVLKA